MSDFNYVEENDVFLPSEHGYLKLCAEYEPLIDKVIKTFDIAYSRESFWLHLNQKLLGTLNCQELNHVNPFSVIDFLNTALKCKINPLDSDITSTYDYYSKSIKPVILMSGFISMYNSDPNANGFKFNHIGQRKIKLSFHRTVTENGKKRTIYEEREEIIPDMVECHLYIKGKDYPYTGICDGHEIGNTNAWQEHPVQMMRNRAFTRAARMLYSTSAMSSYDAYEFNDFQNVQGALCESNAVSAPAPSLLNKDVKAQSAQREMRRTQGMQSTAQVNTQGSTGSTANQIKTVSEEEFMAMLNAATKPKSVIAASEAYAKAKAAAQAPANDSTQGQAPSLASANNSMADGDDGDEDYKSYLTTEHFLDCMKNNDKKDTDKNPIIINTSLDKYDAQYLAKLGQKGA